MSLLQVQQDMGIWSTAGYGWKEHALLKCYIYVVSGRVDWNIVGATVYGASLGRKFEGVLGRQTFQLIYYLRMEEKKTDVDGASLCKEPEESMSKREDSREIEICPGLSVAADIEKGLCYTKKKISKIVDK